MPKKCFVAYSSELLDIAESINLFVDNINSSYSNLVILKDWNELRVTGNIIIHEVCKAIDESDLFICDLTTLSTNVIFELGYAVATNKKIWICMSKLYDFAKTNYKKLGILADIGYVSYENSHDLSRKFIEEQPFSETESTIYEKVIRFLTETKKIDSNYIFYLKSESNSDASLKLTDLLRASNIPIITDDPSEVPSQPLSWYVQNTFGSLAVVVHFVSENTKSILLQNEKYAFIAGLAFGFSKPIRMFAHYPFYPPVDFRSLLLVHQRAVDLSNAIDGWIQDIRQTSRSLSNKLQERKSNIEAFVGLQKINLGEYVAENEEYELSNYFVPTSWYSDALRPGQYLVYVGRKGSGKTANLYQVANRLSKEKINFVCIIKPIDYEMGGIIRLFKESISKADPGYLLESLWKFLIYTELASNLYKSIKNRPTYVPYNDKESEFCAYIERYDDLVLLDFSIRMEHAIDKLCGLDNSLTLSEGRAKVSEILHTKLLGDIREFLGLLLEEKRNVTILVDNLDKAWEKSQNTKELSDFLFGLLSGGQRISRDFQKETLKFKPVNFSLIVFLRSDIFSFVIRNARESDKINSIRMDWNDKKLLERIIEERFSQSLGNGNNSHDIWSNYFAPTVLNVSTRDYIIGRIIPRPRDIIFFCKSALSNAVNHKNLRITEDDILQAEGWFKIG